MDLEQYIQELDKNESKKQVIEDHISKAKEEQEFFISIFPRSEIRNIDVLDYVPGKTIDGDEPDRKTFAYLTEFGSRNFGGIGGGSAKKFAIYMKKDTQELVFPPNFTSSDEAYDHTINLIADCVDYAEEYIKTNNWKKFSDTITELVESKSGTPSIPIISKIIAIYYPDEFIRLWSHQWLNKTLDLFEVKRDDLPEGGKDGKFYEKMQRVVEAKNSHPIMKEWSNEYFSYGIGDYLSPKNKEKKNVSPLLKFVRDEMLMRANYQSIVIKMLLEKKDEASTVSIGDIRKKFDELNFGRYSYTNTSSGEPMGNSAISTVKKALEKFVTFPDSTSEGKAALHLDKCDSKDIPEILKICGQKLVKYHIESLMEKEENQCWFIQAQREGKELENFKKDGFAGVDYYDTCNFDLSGMTKDEIKSKTGTKEYATELYNISQVQKGDVIAVVTGNNAVEEFTIATSDYYFLDSDTERNKHRVNVEYLNFGTTEIGKAKVPAIVRNTDKIKSFLLGEKSESGNYYVVTQNPGSRYNDVEGKQYDYDSDKAHYKNFVEGTNCVVQSKINGDYYFIGYGKVGQLDKLERTKENGRKITDITAKYSKYTKFVEKKARTNEINQKMLRIAFPNSEGNPQPPAMLEIPYSLYREIIGGDLIKNDQGSDTLIEESRTIKILKQKKNIILYGPPGTGKTFTAKKIAKQMNGITKTVTFHQSYGYEEFIEGIRPQSINNVITYPVKPGVFKKFCNQLPLMNWRQAAIHILNQEDTALHYKEITKTSMELGIAPEDTWQFTTGYPRKTPWLSQLREMTEDIRINNENSIFKKSLDDNGKEIPGMYELNKKSTNYENEIKSVASLQNNDSETPKIFIIDEINRGNISKIFGELITIIENDKRGTEITLAYSGEQFSVPKNIYIIGTMNTADQSLTHIDAALKRRFSSIEVMPDSLILKKGMKGLSELLDKINEKVREKRSRDNQIGHSYFMQDGKAITEMKELQFVFATDIIPLLRDYFYDSDDDLKEVLGEQFIDWDEGSDRTVKEDWQNNIETFRTAIKQAYDVII